MGSRNPDRIPLSERRPQGETVADMFAWGWLVRAECRECRLVLMVDLKVIAAVKGGEFSLWGKSTRCRRVQNYARCRGAVFFTAKAPGMDGFEMLADIPSTTREPFLSRRRADRSPS